MTITITFQTSTATERKDEIQKALNNNLKGPNGMFIRKIRSAVLFREGYPDLEGGFNDEDLAFADGIKIITA